jgi:hypothetical protein
VDGLGIFRLTAIIFPLAGCRAERRNNFLSLWLLEQVHRETVKPSLAFTSVASIAG